MNDPRVELLTKLMKGDKEKAVGMCVCAWFFAQRFYAKGKRIPKPIFLAAGWEPLLFVDLADEDDDGIYVKGTKEQFAWIEQRHQAAQRSAEKRRGTPSARGANGQFAKPVHRTDTERPSVREPYDRRYGNRTDTERTPNLSSLYTGAPPAGEPPTAAPPVSAPASPSLAGSLPASPSLTKTGEETNQNKKGPPVALAPLGKKAGAREAHAPGTSSGSAAPSPAPRFNFGDDGVETVEGEVIPPPDDKYANRNDGKRKRPRPTAGGVDQENAPEWLVRDQETETPFKAACREARTAFSRAYVDRHKTDYTWNARENTLIQQFVKAVGYADAPEVLAFYVWHNKAFYIENRHMLKHAFQDAVSLRTQWKQGRTVTAHDARQEELAQHNLGVLQRWIDKDGKTGGNPFG